MAIDKAVDSSQLNAGLKAVADAIREKGGTSGALMFPGGFADAIAAIQSGSGGSGLACDMGEFAFETDLTTNQYSTKSIPHNLGETPDFILVWTDEYAGLTEALYTTETTVGFIWMRGLTGTQVRATSSVNQRNPLFVYFYISGNNYRMKIGTPTSSSYGIVQLPTDTEFYGCTIGPNSWIRAGVTYNYFVSKAWWNIGGAVNAE